MKAKWCWIATETRKGWRLKLAIGEKDEYTLAGLLFSSPAEVAKVVGKGHTVYVHLASSADAA